MSDSRKTRRKPADRKDLKTAFCFACLSSDRTLYPLGPYTSLFHKLVDEKYLHEPSISLCWECTALLKKVQLFKEKVDHAQMMLSHHCMNNKKTLPMCVSTLTCITLNPQLAKAIGEQIKSITKTEQTAFEPDIDIKEEIDSYLDTFDSYKQEDVKEENVTSCKSAPKVEDDSHAKELKRKAKTRAKRKRGPTVKEERVKEKGNSRRRGSAFDCTDCKCTFTYKQEFFQHCKSEHTTFICDYCGQHFRSKMVILNHIIRNHCPLQCSLCGTTYKKPSHYQRHMTVEHGEKIVEDTYCVPCDKQFLHRCAYKQHIMKSSAHALEREGKKEIERVPCPECPKTFQSRYTMASHHQLMHKRDSRHKCHYCSKQFLNTTSLSRHINIIHEGIKPPKDKFCTECGRGFADTRTLSQHMNTHTGEKPFQCAHCDSRFTQRTPMMRHIKSVHLKC